MPEQCVADTVMRLRSLLNQARTIISREADIILDSYSAPNDKTVLLLEATPHSVVVEYNRMRKVQRAIDKELSHA